MPSMKPLWRSCPGVEVIRPLSSTTLPLPPRVFLIHSPAALPIFLLSAPMNCVYLSPTSRRSSTITGMRASIAAATGRSAAGLHWG